MCYKWSQTRSTSYTNLIFPVTFIKVCPMPIQNTMHCWWIEIKDIPKYKLYDNIGDLSKTTFWYHSYDTKRNLWVMLCSHCPINDSFMLFTHYCLPCSYVTSLLTYCRGWLRVKRFIYQVTMYCKNFITSTLLEGAQEVLGL